MSLVRRLACHAQRLGDLLPCPAIVNRTFHRLTLHPISEASEADHRGDRGGRVIGRGWHACTILR